MLKRMTIGWKNGLVVHLVALDLITTENRRRPFNYEEAEFDLKKKMTWSKSRDVFHAKENIGIVEKRRRRRRGVPIRRLGAEKVASKNGASIRKRIDENLMSR